MIDLDLFCSNRIVRITIALVSTLNDICPRPLKNRKLVIFIQPIMVILYLRKEKKSIETVSPALFSWQVPSRPPPLSLSLSLSCFLAQLPVHLSSSIRHYHCRSRLCWVRRRPSFLHWQYRICASVPGNHGPVCCSTTGPPILLLLLFGVNSVDLGGLVTTGEEDANVDVGRTRVWHAGDADLGEQVHAVGRLGGTHGGEVARLEGGQIRVAEVRDGGEVFLLMLWRIR